MSADKSNGAGDAARSPENSERVSIAAQVAAEQVRQLYRLSRVGYAGSLVNALVVGYALKDQLPLAGLTAWIASVVVVLAARVVLYRTFTSRVGDLADLTPWRRAFIAGVAAMGINWGLLGSLLYPTASLPHQFLVIFVIGGMAASAVIVLAPVRTAFIAFAVPSLLPVTLTVFLQASSLHVFMGVLMVVFIAVVLTAGPIMSRLVYQSTRMKYENSALLLQLSDRDAHTRRINDELRQQIEVQERTAEDLRQASEKLEGLIDASPLAIIVHDATGCVERWNPAAERMYGWTEAEVKGGQSPGLGANQHAEREAFRRRILSGESFSGVQTVRWRKDGTPLDVSLSAALLRNRDGYAVGYVTIVEDITLRRRAEQQQLLQGRVTLLLTDAQTVEEAIPRVLQAIGETLDFVYGARWVFDRERYLLCCRETWSVGEPLLEDFRDHSAQRTDRGADAIGMNRRVWTTGEPVWIADIEREPGLKRHDAALEAGLRSACAVPILVASEFYGVIEFFARTPRVRDPVVVQTLLTVSSQIGQFIARKQAEHDLQFVASHDALTGLINRATFMQRAQHAIAQAQRYGRRLAVLFIDLDGFKTVNDTQGHDAGDALLVELAQRLRNCLRESDTIGRMGGDEFVLLIEQFDDEAQLAEVGRKVLEAVDAPMLFRDRTCRVSASIGVATYPQDGRDGATLLKNADIAMYRAKEQGKNNFQFHSAEMNSHLLERLSLEAGLRQAVERDELVLHYQPRIDVRDGRVAGVEALVRWQHPTRGLLHPSDFLPIADDTGLYVAIGEWVAKTACQQMRVWQQQGLPYMKLSLNLSPRQLGYDRLFVSIREALHAAGLEPSRLQLELTEQSLMRDIERSERLLEQFRKAGIGVLVDDFGTGYSALGVLRRFPLDGLKIDRALVTALPEKVDSVAIVEAVISMARGLRLAASAEGVETREQLEFLRDRGCHVMQGNYLCPAAPADVVTATLRKFSEELPQDTLQLRLRRTDSATSR